MWRRADNEAACRQAADLGFDGKTLIHPKTIAKANEIFAPAPADIDWARRVIAANESPQDTADAELMRPRRKRASNGLRGVTEIQFGTWPHIEGAKSRSV